MPNPTDPSPRHWPSRYALGTIMLGWLLWLWWMPASHLMLTVDDSFYYIQIARNASEGWGWTFDRINPTNGFHPLWCWCLTTLQWLLPNHLSFPMMTRLILTCQLLLLWSALARLPHHAPRSSRQTWWLLPSLFLPFYTMKIVVNGMESALYLWLLVAAVRFWKGITTHRPARTMDAIQSGLQMGLLCALVGLVRLEANLFVVALLAWGVVTQCQTTQRDASLSLRRVLACWSAAGLAYGLIVGLYLLHNQSSTGHWLPVSGAIKWHARPGPLWLRGLAAAVLLGVGFAWLRRWLTKRSPILRQTAPLVCFCLVQWGIYAVWRGQWRWPIWYYVPYLLLCVMLIGPCWQALVNCTRHANILKWAYVCTGCILVVWTWMVRLQPASYAIYVARQEAGQWLRQHAPNKRAAGWDSGIVGAAFNDQLMNLDGLVNSWEYNTQYLARNRTAAFVDKRHPIDYLVQHIPTRYLAWGRWRGVDLRKRYVVYARCINGTVTHLRHRQRRWALLILATQPHPHAPLYKEWLKQAHPCRRETHPPASQRTRPQR